MESANRLRRGEGDFPLGEDLPQVELSPHSARCSGKAADIERVRAGKVGGQNHYHGPCDWGPRRAPRASRGKVFHTVQNVAQTCTAKPGNIVVNVPHFESGDV